MTRDELIRKLAEVETDSSFLPKAWRELIIAGHMEVLNSYTDEELKIFFEAMFGKEENR